MFFSFFEQRWVSTSVKNRVIKKVFIADGSNHHYIELPGCPALQIIDKSKKERRNVAVNAGCAKSPISFPPYALLIMQVHRDGVVWACVAYSAKCSPLSGCSPNSPLPNGIPDFGHLNCPVLLPRWNWRISNSPLFCSDISGFCREHNACMLPAAFFDFLSLPSTPPKLLLVNMYIDKILQGAIYVWSQA